MSVFDGRSKGRADEANSRRMSRDEEGMKGFGRNVPTVEESLRLIGKAKREVLFLRQVGDQLLSTLSDAENPVDAASSVAEITKEASENMDGLQLSMNLLTHVLESVMARGPQESNSTDQFQKVWRNVSTLEKHQVAQEHCKTALKVFQSERKNCMQMAAKNRKRSAKDDTGMISAIKKLKTGANDGHQLKAVVQSVAETSGLRVFCAKASGALTRDPASADEVRVVCQPIFGAAVVLQSPGTATPVRVVIDEFGRAGRMDGWSQSSHCVFQRASQIANTALHYFWENVDERAASNQKKDASRKPGVVVLERILLWLCTLRDMFEVPCAVTGTILAADPTTHQLLPPIFRPYKLTHAELIAAASENGQRMAYHIHVANM